MHFASASSFSDKVIWGLIDTHELNAGEIYVNKSSNHLPLITSCGKKPCDNRSSINFDRSGGTASSVALIVSRYICDNKISLSSRKWKEKLTFVSKFGSSLTRQPNFPPLMVWSTLAPTQFLLFVSTLSS